MRSNEPSREIWPPRPGFFKLRLVPKGWQVPARISFNDGLWLATIDGVASTPSEDPVAAGVDRIWHSGTSITESDYDYLNALRVACTKYQPHHPAANPRQPINPQLLSPIEPRKATR